MKIKIASIAFVAFLSAALFTGCNSNKKNTASEKRTTLMASDRAHNSRNSLDYQGTYSGTMPCADCSGIDVEITLSGDNFKRKMTYQGKEGQNMFDDSGKYVWNEEGDIITLGGDPAEQYQVGENQLIALDMQGRHITGDLADMYILKKK